jgi:hypothetical protein
MKIIGLTGPAGSGKDTVRQILEKSHLQCTGLAFADPMRAMLAPLLDLCGVGNEWMTQRELKELPIPGLGQSYRVLAQRLGTEWGRSIDPDFWVKVAAASMAEVMNIKGPDTVFVISDVRFDNEAQWVKDHGGVIWHIHRPSAQAVAAHQSENGIRPELVDHNILNNNTLSDLYAEVSQMGNLQMLKWRRIGQPQITTRHLPSDDTEGGAA